MGEIREVASSACCLEGQKIPNTPPRSTRDGATPGPERIHAKLAQILPLLEFVPQEPNQALALAIRVRIVVVEPQAVEHRESPSNRVVERDHLRFERFQIRGECARPER